MIAANVCAAETIEERRLPCMYRVHVEPDPKKLEALREVLDGLGYRLARGQVLTPKQFNRILDWAADKPYRHLISDMILRTQSMAVYSPDNRGHFGLALARTPTSPHRSAATPICSSIVRSSPAWGWVTAASSKPAPSTSKRPPSTSPRPSAAPRPPSARPSTAMSRRI